MCAVAFGIDDVGVVCVFGMLRSRSSTSSSQTQFLKHRFACRLRCCMFFDHCVPVVQISYDAGFIVQCECGVFNPEFKPINSGIYLFHVCNELQDIAWDLSTDAEAKTITILWIFATRKNPPINQLMNNENVQTRKKINIAEMNRMHYNRNHFCKSDKLTPLSHSLRTLNPNKMLAIFTNAIDK